MAHVARNARLPNAGRDSYAFGLNIVSALPLKVSGASSRPGWGRAVEIEPIAPDNLVQEWSEPGVVSLRERRDASGALLLNIRHHPVHGYRITAPAHGDFVVSRDGRRVLAAIPRHGSGSWRRLLFAQVLPLASVLQGFELLHASAVVVDGLAWAFVAGSGTGKSSVAAHLIARGARFLTDDVLALEAGKDEVSAHPGPGMLALCQEELRRVAIPHGGRLGRTLGRDDKVILAVQPEASPAPLGALYYLERRSRGTRLSIAGAEPDASRLLASAFVSYLDTPHRLRNHLHVCACLRERVPIFRVQIPRDVHAAQVAAALWKQMRALSAADTWTLMTARWPPEPMESRV